MSIAINFANQNNTEKLKSISTATIQSNTAAALNTAELQKTIASIPQTASQPMPKVSMVRLVAGERQGHGNPFELLCCICMICKDCKPGDFCILCKCICECFVEIAKGCGKCIPECFKCLGECLAATPRCMADCCTGSWKLLGDCCTGSAECIGKCCTTIFQELGNCFAATPGCIGRCCEGTGQCIGTCCQGFFKGLGDCIAGTPDCVVKTCRGIPHCFTEICRGIGDCITGCCECCGKTCLSVSDCACRCFCDMLRCCCCPSRPIGNVNYPVHRHTVHHEVFRSRVNCYCNCYGTDCGCDEPQQPAPQPVVVVPASPVMSRDDEANQKNASSVAVNAQSVVIVNASPQPLNSAPIAAPTPIATATALNNPNAQPPDTSTVIATASSNQPISTSSVVVTINDNAATTTAPTVVVATTTASAVVPDQRPASGSVSARISAIEAQL